MLNRMADIIFDSSKVFSRLKNEKPIKSIYYYSFLLVILISVDLVILYYGETPANLIILKGLNPSLDILVPFLAYYFIINLSLPFIFAGASRFFSKAYKVKTSAVNSLKVFTHASTPFIISLWIPLVNLLAAFWSLFLTIQGISELNGIPFRKSAAITIFSSALVFTLFFIGISIIIISLGMEYNPLQILGLM